ncbi:MAG: HDIG domain-containing protein [Flavobacteriales bacterium]|nr:HDIG domain-containing protein [Flavobacteriales bacterium]PIY10499.1 MAG: phosphohydrolase [Flavobacteriaceae bacterium CG_4_10_14_3_um_filter_33_47]PJB17255.1 MAG: phosphohydrolase [Flavobacteriaceae bacterium CG_4_9_14_3_um_filter_33_16]NCP60007.1 HDIG domain-containing protein [Flavobacteriales bacterium]NCP88748.1 HDIG domain-containing protein [Flavobacteriales bacterium]
MSDFINKLYRNHSLIYKGLLFICSTFLIVYLFPKTGKFKYNFEKGKPWQSENLYAPFNFAIKKSNEEIEAEKKTISEHSTLFFNVDVSIENEIKNLYIHQFKRTFSDSLNRLNRNNLFKSGEQIIEELYFFGILNETYNLPDDKTVIILDDRIEKHTTKYTNLIHQEQVTSIINKVLVEQKLSDYKKEFTALFFDLIQPNLTYDKSFTEKVLKEDLDKISYTRGSIEKETLIISKGEIVEGDKYQILESLKSEYESQVWNASNYNWILFAYTLLVSLALLMLLLFLRKYRLDVFENNTKVTFIFFNIFLMVLITTLVVNYNSKYIYVVPICILPLVFKAFFDARLGLFAHVITVLLLGSIVPNSYEYMFLQIIAGIVTILTVSELYKRANLFISVGQITLIYIIAYFAFFVIHEGSIETIKWETFIWFILCGLATLFVQPLIYIYEKLFGLVSDVSLLELSDTNTKLLKELSNKAPGTFHHSLNVANLAEACANEVGANAMLIRVGALYHDIGKMKNPTYFIENQSTGINPHDELSSKESARIIIEHVIAGIETAKKYNLPDRVIDFIRTHHGTSMVYYFYIKEKELQQGADKSDFSYPGPKPFSKETAILMMCDSVEAASKSLKEPTSTKIDAFVESIINKQIEEGQFLNANITFKEIQSIKKVLKHKLANIYHLRIEYPE